MQKISNQLARASETHTFLFQLVFSGIFIVVIAVQLANYARNFSVYRDHVLSKSIRDEIVRLE